MKPDGTATPPVESAEVVVDPADEATTNEEPAIQDQTPSLQIVNSEMKKAAHPISAAAAAKSKANGKNLDSKNKVHAPGKTKPGLKGSKATTGVVPPPAAHSRQANGVSKNTLNSVPRRPVQATTDIKKTSSNGTAVQTKKRTPTTAAVSVAQSTQVKVSDQKTGAVSRPPVPSMSKAAKPAVSTAMSTLGKKPATATSSGTVKTNITASRPTTAPIAKSRTAAASKLAPTSKASRPTTVPVSLATRPQVRATTTVTKPKMPTSAPSAGQTSQPTKASTTTRKATTSAAPGKPHASTIHTSTVKTSRLNPSKQNAATKHLVPNGKATPSKPSGFKQVPTRKVPPSPRNTFTGSATGIINAAASSPQRGSRSPVVKRQTPKPTQSVSPLVMNDSAILKSTSKPVLPLVATDEALAHDELLSEPLPPLALDPEEQLHQQISEPAAIQQDEEVQALVLEPSNVEPFTEVQPESEPLAESAIADISSVVSFSPSTVTVTPEFQRADDYISLNEPENSQKTVTTSCELVNLPKGSDAIRKAEQSHSTVDDEEEEREYSQQVSVSEMSGTQPTEESRPGSAGLTGSLWRAGGLISELDSEDVSCSQQGASELSAPGVLEGTESMDDLGEASLKGADGEGASAGSPDFEKVPDIPANDDDDDVYDMEVGSEMAEDSNRHCPENEDDDGDVDMVSEGVTESGLESYGNADDDDFAEDYRLDNLNRMQHLSPGLNAAPQSEGPHYPDPLVPFLQPDLLTCPFTNQWQAGSEPSIQISSQTSPDVKNEGPSPDLPSLKKQVSGSSQSTVVTSPDIETMPLDPQRTSPLSKSLCGTKNVRTWDDTSAPDQTDTSSDVFNQQERTDSVNSIPVTLPDVARELGSSLAPDQSEESLILPADAKQQHVESSQTLEPSSNSLTEAEVRDNKKEMNIKSPTEQPLCGSIPDGLAVLENDEAGVELEGSGGNDTPQSITSGASCGFECTTTSNSNAQSTTEGWLKSPGIFSLDNEEQLPDESRDQSLSKELTPLPNSASVVADPLHNQEEEQRHTNEHYMLCGKASEQLSVSCSLGSAVPKTALTASDSLPKHHEDWDLHESHSYYASVTEKTDSALAGNV